MLNAIRRLAYRLLRRFLGFWARPTVIGAAAARQPPSVVYALAHRSCADAALLDIIAEREALPSPAAALPDFGEMQRVFFLNRPVRIWRRSTMRAAPERMQRLEAALAGGAGPLHLVPVSIFWGRAANKERSIIRALFADSWAVSSKLRRLLILLLSRGDILVRFGDPLPWHDRDGAPRCAERSLRRTARLLRVKFRNHKVAALGPDLSHRRTLMQRILESAAVRAAVRAEGKTDNGQHARRMARRAETTARKIAANMSYPAVRLIEPLLAWFWNRIYDGIDVHGVRGFAPLAETHTLVYVPCHRSHIDYLLLSYILHRQGLMLPHIASGENLAMPVIGGLLRRCGAFFMRRSFSGDRIYRAVFSEYIYQVFRRGHAVEYFIEGGRSRTGRLLPPRTGMLQMTLDAHRRGVPRPIAFIPVYIGYEKLIEARGYVEELRGADKQRESVRGVLRGLRLARQSFGTAQVSFGTPIELGAFLEALPEDAGERPVRLLGTRIAHAINACAAINGMNLIALATLSTPRQAIEETVLAEQIDLLRELIARDGDRRYRVAAQDAREIIRHAEALGMIERETGRAGEPDIISHDRFAAVLMTWYRNNALHAVAAPACIACLLANRRIGLRRQDLIGLHRTIYPYIARELNVREDGAPDQWIGHLRACGLIDTRGNALVAPRAPAARLKLRLLANALMPMLESFYIGIVLLARAGSGRIGRTALGAEWRRTARRISRLYGINAPEFADSRLFESLLQGLSEAGIATANADGKLVFDSRIPLIARAGDGVIALELRHALGR